MKSKCDIQLFPFSHPYTIDVKQQKRIIWRKSFEFYILNNPSSFIKHKLGKAARCSTIVSIFSYRGSRHSVFLYLNYDREPTFYIEDGVLWYVFVLNQTILTVLFNIFCIVLLFTRLAMVLKIIILLYPIQAHIISVRLILWYIFFLESSHSYALSFQVFFLSIYLVVW